MLVDDACSIYEHRPRACRTYDCRIFRRASARARHRPSPGGRLPGASPRRRTEAPRHAAVIEAATFLGERGGELAEGLVPSPATPRAVLAVEIHEAFLRYDDKQPGHGGGAPASVVEVELRRRMRRRPAI